MKHVLPLLIETAQAARDRQVGLLAQARQAADQAGGTLQRLAEFRADCLARSAGGTLGTTDATALQQYQRFVARLDEATAMQQQEVRARHARQAEQQARLQQVQQRLLAFQALQQRDLRAREAQAARGEQRAADEFAARAFGRGARGAAG